MSNKKISINASWIMVSRAIQLILTFLTTMYVSRYLGPNEYGKITYVYSYIQLFLPLCTLGMNDIVVKQLHDDPDNNDEILGSIIGLRLFSSIISMFLSILMIEMFNHNEVFVLIGFLQSFSLLFQAFDTLLYFYHARLLSKTTGIIISLAYIITAIFRIVGILLKRSIAWFAFAMSLDFGVIAVLLLIVYFMGSNRLRFSIKMSKKLLSKSIYYIFAGLLVVIYGKVTDTILLGKMIDTTTVGYYSAATTLCNAWPFVLTAIIDSMAPVIIDTYDNDHELFKRKLRQLYAIIFYISVVVAIGVTIFSKVGIDILYGPSYYSASIPLKIYAWSTAFSYIGVARNIWMQCEKKTSYEIIISLFGALTNIVLNYILIKRYGIIGAAIAAVLTQFLTNFIFLFFMKDTRENAKLILDAILLRNVINKEEKSDV